MAEILGAAIGGLIIGILAFVYSQIKERKEDKKYLRQIETFLQHIDEFKIEGLRDKILNIYAYFEQAISHQWVAKLGGFTLEIDNNYFTHINAIKSEHRERVADIEIKLYKRYSTDITTLRLDPSLTTEELLDIITQKIKILNL